MNDPEFWMWIRLPRSSDEGEVIQFSQADIDLERKHFERRYRCKVEITATTVVWFEDRGLWKRLDTAKVVS